MTKTALTVVPVNGKKMLKEFIDFPLELYKGSDKWVPAFEDDEYKSLGSDNPSLEFCDRELFLAYKDGKIAGRVAAIINHNANKKWNENSVRFGWIDFIEDFEVCRALIDAVTQWGKDRGATKIKGPLGFTDMDREGLLVEGFENESPFTVIYNYPYYPEYLERLGFTKDVDWTQRVMDIPSELPAMFNFADKISERFGIRIYTAGTIRKMAKRGREMFHVLNEAFAGLYEYTKLTQKQIDGYVNQYVPVLNKDLVAFVVNEKDELVGFTVTMPHISAAVRKAKGRILPFGWIHLLPALSPKRNDTTEALLIGILPEYQAKGAALLMFKYLMENYIRLGIKHMLMNPQLEENHKVQSLWDNFDTRMYQRRRSYVKDIAEVTKPKTKQIMTNTEYFHNMLPKEEFESIPYLPTMGQFVDWFPKQYADKPALSDQTNTITYEELGKRIARRRAFIGGLGLPKGAHIAIWDRNSQDAVELYLAITSAGYVAMTFPTQLPAPAAVGCCMKFDIAAIFVRDEFMPLTEGIQGTKVLPAASIADVEAPAVLDVDPDSPAAIFFTGGTTGSPKGAVLSHRALMRGNYNAIFKPGHVIGVHRYIALLPFSHVFGAIAGMAGCFYTGNLLFTAEDMKATIGKLPMIKPTLLVIVPGICDILSGLVKMYGPQFLGGELRMIISGAANVPPRLVDIFTKLGVEFCFGYGLTETANLTSANADAVRKPTSIGRIYPGQETKLVDGELLVKGDNVFSGYYKDPVRTAEAFTEDGWFRTGDLCRFDEEGFLYITGRIKNLIILPNGENVSPESLEEPFYADPCVRDAMVKEDDLNGSKVIAIEILPFMPAFDGKTPEEIHAYMQALVEKVNATLPTTHRILKMTVRTEDFKRTGSMKVARV